MTYLVFNAPAPAAVFAASIPVAYLISPTATKLTWLSLVPISWLLNRFTARWLPTTHGA